MWVRVRSRRRPQKALHHKRSGGCPATPHVRQQLSWDCGLACVLMVLRAAAPNTAALDLAMLRQYCATTRYLRMQLHTAITGSLDWVCRARLFRC